MSLFAFAALLPGLALAAPKIAVVDVQAVMESANHFREGAAAINKMKVEKQAQLEGKQKELRAKKEKLDAQRAISDAKVIDGQEAELMKEAQELTQGFMKTQQELSGREKKLADQMLSRIEVLVREAAMGGDFDLVFEKGAPESPNVLYMRSSSDLTKQVIELYQQRFKDKPLQ